MYRHLILLIFVIGHIALDAQSINFYHAILQNDLSDQFICLQPDSELHEAEIFSTVAVLFRIDNNEEGVVEFSFDKLSTSDDISIKLVDEADASIFYGFRFNNGQVFIQDVIGTQVIGGKNLETHMFAIARCQNTITYLFDNSIVIQRPLSNMDFSLINELSTQSAQSADINLSFYETDAGTCIWPYYQKDREIYFDLSREFNNRYLVISDHVLRIKYIQKYQVTNGVNDAVLVEVTDQSNNTTTSINDVIQNYGLNTTEIDLSSLSLVPNRVYTVRIGGMNKGEVYHLKIKTE